MFVINKQCIGKTVLPGDTIGTYEINGTTKDLEQSHGVSDAAVIKLGPGLTQMETTNQIVAHKAGILRYMPSHNKYFVENNQKRYIPMLEDVIIGVIMERGGEHYSLDINAQSRAHLNKLSFDGASKRNKPNLQLNQIVYCRIIVANKDLEPEVTCCSRGKKKDWVTGECTFGELRGGYLIQCSLALCRKLLKADNEVLKLLGEKIQFEIAVGMNGRVWINSKLHEDTILIANAILSSEHLKTEDAIQMIKKLLASPKKK